MNPRTGQTETSQQPSRAGGTVQDESAHNHHLHTRGERIAGGKMSVYKRRQRS